MNLCFIIGKIITKIRFDFIINSKNISIATFKIELSNNSIINIKAYDEIADYCFSNLIKGDTIAIQGELNSQMEIIIKEIDNFIIM